MYFLTVNLYMQIMNVIFMNICTFFSSVLKCYQSKGETVMVFDASSSWIIFVSLGTIIVVMVSSFLAYLCGCCKKIPK